MGEILREIVFPLLPTEQWVIRETS